MGGWIGWVSPGGVRYRAPYSANNHLIGYDNQLVGYHNQPFKRNNGQSVVVKKAEKEPKKGHTKYYILYQIRFFTSMAIALNFTFTQLYFKRFC